MTTLFSIIGTILLLALVPLLFLTWLTESDRERARRWRHQEGLSYARIATRLGTTQYRVRKLLA